MPIIHLSCAWLLGILVGLEFKVPLALAGTALLPPGLIFIFPHWKKALVLSGLCVAVFFAAVLYLRLTLPADGGSAFTAHSYAGAARVRGFVSDDPEAGPRYTSVRLSAVTIRRDDEWLPMSGSVLLTVPRYPEYHYGDVLTAEGELEGRPSTPALSDDESGYWEYLAGRDIFWTMFYPETELVGKGEGSRLLVWIYGVRHRLMDMLARILPEPQAALAQGITLGIRANIPPSLKTDFVRTGTAHLLAI